MLLLQFVSHVTIYVNIFNHVIIRTIYFKRDRIRTIFLNPSELAEVFNVKLSIDENNLGRDGVALGETNSGCMIYEVRHIQVMGMYKVKGRPANQYKKPLDHSACDVLTETCTREWLYRLANPPWVG